MWKPYLKVFYSYRADFPRNSSLNVRDLRYLALGASQLVSGKRR